MRLHPTKLVKRVGIRASAVNSVVAASVYGTRSATWHQATFRSNRLWHERQRGTGRSELRYLSMSVAVRQPRCRSYPLLRCRILSRSQRLRAAACAFRDVTDSGSATSVDSCESSRVIAESSSRISAAIFNFSDTISTEL